jgi:hypothetical protein
MTPSFFHSLLSSLCLLAFGVCLAAPVQASERLENSRVAAQNLTNNVCSIEVKNYNIATNPNGLVNNVAKQAADRAVHLPQGMQQTVVIDVRGQVITAAQEQQIVEAISVKTNGIIGSDAIKFMKED